MISGLNFAEIAEGAALLALDLGEIANLGLVTTKSSNAAFRREISKLAKKLQADHEFSSGHRRDRIEMASKLRARGHYPWTDEECRGRFLTFQPADGLITARRQVVLSFC